MRSTTTTARSLQSRRCPRSRSCHVERASCCYCSWMTAEAWRNSRSLCGATRRSSHVKRPEVVTGHHRIPARCRCRRRRCRHLLVGCCAMRAERCGRKLARRHGRHVRQCAIRRRASVGGTGCGRGRSGAVSLLLLRCHGCGCLLLLLLLLLLLHPHHHHRIRWRTSGHARIRWWCTSGHRAAVHRLPRLLLQYHANKRIDDIIRRSGAW